jgi:hypothetical protein
MFHVVPDRRHEPKLGARWSRTVSKWQSFTRTLNPRSSAQRRHSGTTLLTTTYTAAERGRAQAVNDITIFGVGLACSLSAGALLDAMDWQRMNLLLLPWLAVAALAIIGTNIRLSRETPARAVQLNERQGRSLT